MLQEHRKIWPISQDQLLTECVGIALIRGMKQLGLRWQEGSEQTMRHALGIASRALRAGRESRVPEVRTDLC